MVAFLLFCLLFVMPVQAQESSAPVLKTDLIWERESLDDEIAIVKSTYQAQLENYLYHDKLFRIAYDQNKQLNTLVSIEDVTQKGKSLGIYRDEVLMTYLNLLRLELISTEGIELSLKERYILRLEATIEYLSLHQENLKNLNGRDEVATSLASFTADQGGVGSLANEILVLLTVGNLQAIYDKSFVLKKDIDNFLVQEGTFDLPEIERASFETGRSLDSAKLKLDTFWVDVIKKGQGNWYLSKIYDDLPRTMNPIYVNLSQSISYLNELLSL
jgi:hypothetical protein